MAQDDKATEHPAPQGEVPALSRGPVFVSRIALSHSTCKVQMNVQG